MKQNFAFPLHIQGTHEELDGIQNLLETRFGYQTAFSPLSGYDERLCSTCLVTNWAGDNGLMGYTSADNPGAYERTVLQLPQDKELLLALAAMRRDGEFRLGEVLVFTQRGPGQPPLGTLAKVISDRHYENKCDMVEIEWLSQDTHSYSHGPKCGYYLTRFRRARKEEIINLYRHGSPTLKSDPLPFTEPETRKIIGYKAPFGIYGGRVKAGTIYEQIGGSTNYGCSDVSGVLPVEIVEKWEPVYEEAQLVRVIKIGQNKKLDVYVEPGKSIRCEGEEITEASIQSLLNQILYMQSRKSFPWEINALVKIGCLEVNTEDLKKVLDAYRGGAK